MPEESGRRQDRDTERMASNDSIAARRKRTKPSSGLEMPLQAMVATPVHASSEADSPALDAVRQQAVDDFKSSLEKQPGLDAEGRDFIVDHFRQAIVDAPADPKLAPPDPESWTQALNMLVESGLIEENDRNALARQFDDVLLPMQQAEAKRALEFAERVRRDGEASALEWLNAQEGGTSNPESSGLATAVAGTESAESITRSRSRRLRGPPKAL